MPWLEIQEFALMSKVTIHGDIEPDSLSWKSPPELRFPTLTRPIPRNRPPIAALRESSEEARKRWVEDQFRFPPYTYEEKYLLTSEKGFLHKLPTFSCELLMGFKAHHTLKLDRELFEKSTLQLQIVGRRRWETAFAQGRWPP